MLLFQSDVKKANISSVKIAFLWDPIKSICGGQMAHGKKEKNCHNMAWRAPVRANKNIKATLFKQRFATQSSILISFWNRIVCSQKALVLNMPAWMDVARM